MNSKINEDVFDREATDKFYGKEDGWQREKLVNPDVLATAWRKLCARQPAKCSV